MSRKANQDSNLKTLTPTPVSVEETIAANSKLASVTQGLADGSIPKVESIVPGGAPGGPPPAAQSIIDIMARKSAPRDVPTDAGPKAKQFRVMNQHLVRGAVGVEVQIKGLPTFLQHGRVISELSYDITRLRQQGVVLEEIVEPKPQAETATA